MSHRNSAAAIIHMLQTVGCNRILTTPRGHNVMIDTLISSVQEECPSDLSLNIEYIPSPDLMYLHITRIAHENFWEAYPLRKRSLEDICVYLHSSGSTGFPKSIPFTFHATRAALNMGRSLFADILLIVAHGLHRVHSQKCLRIDWLWTRLFEN
jgi:long-subunit acyl-CoA synthetase (AMP-forming)